MSTVRPFSSPGVGERVAVIDIGSNSIRLVVYDGLKRAPLPIFNEKIMCGLGRGLARTGRLNAEGTVAGLTNLVRFSRLARGLGVERIEVLATAAVREAEDGAAFIDEVERLTGLRVQVVPGVREAQLAAMGVLSGTPGAKGVVGDLGGGSLELVWVDHHRLTNHVTLPLGPLRLMELGNARQGSLVKHIDQFFESQPWLESVRGETFYAVGGAWRSLAKLHMERSGHPLHIIHHYTIPAPQARDFAADIAGLNRSVLEKSPSTRRRSDTVPYAALVLERLLRAACPERVVFSAYGLREGHIFSLLSEETRRTDPLIAACGDLARASGRSVPADATFAWTEGLIAGEDEATRRLREASCHLCEIAWAEHPDYRHEIAFQRVLRYPFPGVDHEDRVFLAMTAFARYCGGTDGPAVDAVRSLLPEGRAAKALVLGLALRLAHTLTGGAAAALSRTSLRVRHEELVLSLPEDRSVMTGEVVERRLNTLAGALNRVAVVAWQ